MGSTCGDQPTQAAATNKPTSGNNSYKRTMGANLNNRRKYYNLTSSVKGNGSGQSANKSKTLPQTGESETKASILGLALASLGALLGHADGKRRRDRK